MMQEKALELDQEHLAKRLKLGKEILYLTQKDCIKNGPSVQETINIITKTLIAHGKKEYEMPAKIGVHPFSDVFFHAMPAYIPGQRVVGMKWIECYPRNPQEYGLPQTSSLLILNDVLSGYPIAIMDGAWLTAMRTPAKSAISAKLLHPNAETFGMFGCGVQGLEHVRFVTQHMPNLKKLYLYDVREENIDRVIAQLQSSTQVQLIKGTSFEQVAKSCEVLCSATFITKENLAYVKAEWVGKGQTILPVDLNTFFDYRIPLECDKYITDSIDELNLFAGYYPMGLPKVFCETGELVAGLATGRENPDQLIVCSNIGMAVDDMAMAKVIFENALESGDGMVLPL